MWLEFLFGYILAYLTIEIVDCIVAIKKKGSDKNV